MSATRVLDGLVAALVAITLAVLLGGAVPAAGRLLPGRAEDVVVTATVVAAVRHLLQPYALLPAAPRRLVIARVAVYAVALSFITVTRHWNLRTHAVDLALHDQMVWAIVNRGAPYSTLPELHGINLRDFHPQALAIPLPLTALHAVLTARWPLYWGAVVLTLTCREDASLPVLGLGAWALLVRRRPWTGLVTAGLALGWLLAATRWMIPHFRGQTWAGPARVDRDDLAHRERPDGHPLVARRAHA